MASRKPWWLEPKEATTLTVYSLQSTSNVTLNRHRLGRFALVWLVSLFCVLEPKNYKNKDDTFRRILQYDKE